jgi:hypothetical protein
MAKKKKPAEYYFGKFLNTLREEEGKIKIFGNTYSSDNKNLTIKSLVQEICEFDSPMKIDTITRSGELTKTNSRKGRISKKQKNVINELSFYFINDKPEIVGWNYKEKEVNDELGETFERIRKSLMESHRKSLFFMEGEGPIQHVYPNLSKKIINSVIVFFRDNTIENIYKSLYLNIREDKPFYELTKKIFPQINVTDTKNGPEFEFKKIYLPSNLDKFLNQYESKVSELEISPYNSAWAKILPQFNFGVERFNDESSINDRIENKFEDVFIENASWFDKYRYLRLKKMEPKLLKMNVNKWPKWTIDHLILIQIEYILLQDHLVEIVDNELSNNINLCLFTSTNGDAIDMQQDFDDFIRLAQVLTSYRFPGGFKKHVQIERDKIISGNFYRVPNDLMSRNKEELFNGFFAILNALINQFFEQICTTIGLKEYEKNEMRTRVLDSFVTEYHERH